MRSILELSPAEQFARALQLALAVRRRRAEARSWGGNELRKRAAEYIARRCELQLRRMADALILETERRLLWADTESAVHSSTDFLRESPPPGG